MRNYLQGYRDNHDFVCCLRILRLLLSMWCLWSSLGRSEQGDIWRLARLELWFLGKAVTPFVYSETKLFLAQKNTVTVTARQGVVCLSSATFDIGWGECLGKNGKMNERKLKAKESGRWRNKKVEEWRKREEVYCWCIASALLVHSSIVLSFPLCLHAMKVAMLKQPVYYIQKPSNSKNNWYFELFIHDQKVSTK